MILSEDAVLRELLSMSEKYVDITDFLAEADDYFDNTLVSEEYDKAINRLKLDILDIEKFVRVNRCKPITNARPFLSPNTPSPDGLLSNEIFGFTQKERMGTYAYIDLHGWFMDPSCYKTWSRLDSAVKNIVFGVKYYTIDEHGMFVEDEENGNTGLDWLRKNMDKIQFKDSTSNTKKISKKYLEANRQKMWINKYIVIPPFYRDKNSNSSRSRAVVGLGGVNKIYTNLIVSADALTATQEYGFDSTDGQKGRVQDIILQLYDFFCGNTNPALDSSTGSGLSSKLGLFRRVGMSKTSDFSSRLVISPVDLKANKPDDLMTNIDKCSLPLYSAITQFRDFVMFNVRQFFENEFVGATSYPVLDKNMKSKSITPEDPEIIFGDERIEKEIDRFLHGYNNRFVPIEVPAVGTKEVFYMKYKGRGRSPENPVDSELALRRLTWCDVFYMAAVESVRDKHVLITRFPIDYFSNQFATKVEVASTIETEEIEYDGTVYKWYPKIREEDIGTDTSNRFVDTMRFNNLYLSGIGGDYDGDTVTCKGVYTREANDELDKLMNSKQYFVTYGCKPLKEPGADSIQSMYALTKLLTDVKVTPSDKITFK